MKLSLRDLPARDALVIRSMLRVLDGLVDAPWVVDDDQCDVAFFDPSTRGTGAASCDHRVALLPKGWEAQSPGTATLQRPLRISHLRSILTEISRQAASDRPRPHLAEAPSARLGGFSFLKRLRMHLGLAD